MLHAKSQFITKDEQQYLQKNAITICADSNLTSSNWSGVAPFLEHKRFILLGEFNHGSREVFRIRNELIRYLHEKEGVNIIFFESGIGELAVIDLDKKGMSPIQMTAGLFGGWRTKEFRELFEYISKEKITVAGIDVQRTGGAFIKLLEKQGVSCKLDSTIYSKLEERYGLLQRELGNRRAVYDSLQPRVNHLITDYGSTYSRLQTCEPESKSKERLLTLRTISNRIHYLSYMLQFLKDQDWNKRWAARDSAMADNIDWLTRSFYKDKKIVVVAHNFHIAKSNPKERTMGEFLSGKYPGEIYSLATFAGMGEYADNSGKPERMLPADTAGTDIKHIIENRDAFASFLNIPVKKEKSYSWLFEDITVNDTFIDLSNSRKMILASQFDGLLLIKRVSVPEK